MFKSITIRGLGPHLDRVVVLDPRGTTEISGRSESGKSTVLRALCVGLWGCDLDGRPLDPAAITAGAERAEVELVTARGTTFRRSMTRKGTKTRERIGPDDHGVPTTYTSDKEWNTALDRLSRPVLRLIAVPMAWRELAESAGGGRDLRDLVVGLLPPADLRAEVERLAGVEIPLSMLLTPKAAEAARTDAKTERERAEGAFHALIAADQTADIQLRPEADVEECQAVLAAAAAWAGHDQAAGAAKRAREEYDRRLADYQRRKDAVPLEPERIASDVYQDAHASYEAAKTAEYAAARALDVARAEDGQHKAATAVWSQRLREIEAEIERFEKTETAGAICPTCHQHWADAASHQDSEREKLYDRRRKVIAEKPADIDADPIAARDVYDAATNAHRDAREFVEDIRKRSAAHAEWKRLVAAVGEPPAPLDMSPDLVPPDVPRPLEPEIRSARDAIRAWERHNALAEAAAAMKDRRKADIKAAGDRVHAAKAAVGQAEKILEAVRKAPSEIARRQAAAIGDLGPVSLVFTDGGGVDVLVDGRPWWCASTGRQIVADVWLRMALRRLAGAGWFPIFVDNCGAVAGQDIPVVAPAVLLRTVAGEFRVEVML